MKLPASNTCSHYVPLLHSHGDKCRPRKYRVNDGTLGKSGRGMLYSSASLRRLMTPALATFLLPFIESDIQIFLQRFADRGISRYPVSLQVDLIGGTRGGEESRRLFNRPRSVEYHRSKALELTGFREYSKKDPNKVYIKVNSFFLVCEIRGQARLSRREKEN